MSNDFMRDEVLAHGRALFKQNPDWCTFFREIWGLGGIVRQCFPMPATMAGFEQSPANAELLGMLAKLRVEGPAVPEDKEPIHVITVRLPKSLHELLVVEAHEKRTSMNQLAIVKLLQAVDPALVGAAA